MQRESECVPVRRSLVRSATVALLFVAAFALTLIRQRVIVAGIVTFGTSILTARRRTEALLSARTEEESSRRRDAESLSQLKTDVLAQVAHELRQPLGAIITASGLLQTAATDSSRQRAVAVIGRQTNHRRLLIDDLLDLSRMARQDLQLRKSNLDLCEVVDDSLGVIAADAAARRIELTSSLPPCPVQVIADPTRVRQSCRICCRMPSSSHPRAGESI